MLTDTEIKRLKATGKEYQRSDTKGLTLVIRAGGDNTLDNARKIHAVARRLVEFGKHPATLLDNRWLLTVAGLRRSRPRRKPPRKRKQSVRS